ncbi:hypothetical protein [Pseudonocardia sp. H11422]|uniref:hypothetical protein n=1 Tax=Pseudonocardia sp. H11422 TaxID=2835866 RepID=UPI001BDDBA53
MCEPLRARRGRPALRAEHPAWVAATADGPGHRWLLIRRHPGHGELAYYRCYSPDLVPLRELVRVVGSR